MLFEKITQRTTQQRSIIILDHAYSHKQILVMEKTILSSLEWYLTVPTHYVFLARFIKASIADEQMENMVNYLVELGVMHYDDNVQSIYGSCFCNLRSKICTSPNSHLDQQSQASHWLFRDSDHGLCKAVGVSAMEAATRRE